jgi:hypothetical protein
MLEKSPAGVTPSSRLLEVNRLNQKLSFENCISSPRAIGKQTTMASRHIPFKPFQGEKIVQ